MSSIKYKHWFGSNYVFDDCFGYLKKSRSARTQMRHRPLKPGRGPQRSSVETTRRPWENGITQSIFNHLRIDQQQTTSHSPYTVEWKNGVLMFLIWKVQTTAFLLELESKLVLDSFLFCESYVWFLLIPSSIKTSSPFLVYISFTTSSRFALLRRFITGNCKPWYTSHIFRDPSACGPSSKRPRRPPIVCLFFTEVL